MRSPARFWLNLTQFLLLAGCSNHLPLDINGSKPDRQKLPVESPDNGSDFGMAVAAGSPGSWRGPDSGVMQEPGQQTPICGDTQIQPPQESCDRTNLNGATCASLGYNGGGVLLCNPTTCNYDTIMCRMSRNGWGDPPPVTDPADAGTDDAG